MELVRLDIKRGYGDKLYFIMPDDYAVCKSALEDSMYAMKIGETYGKYGKNADVYTLPGGYAIAAGDRPFGAHALDGKRLNDNLRGLELLLEQAGCGTPKVKQILDASRKWRD